MGEPGVPERGSQPIWRDARLKRREATYRLNAVIIPRLRALGFSFLILYAAVYHAIAAEPRSWGAFGAFAFGITVYTLLSWRILRRYFGKTRVDLGVAFLLLDLLVFVSVIYLTGADKSWLFFLMTVRVADQSYMNFRRLVIFVNAGPAAYLALVLYLAFVEQRDVSWTLEFLKLAFMYGVNLYIAATARPAEATRRLTDTAVRTSRRLVRQLQEKSFQLEEARNKAESASEAKSQFLANMSHEIRTPLNAILGMTELALETATSTEQRRFLEMVKDSADTLTGVINDILDLSKIEARKLDLSHVPFNLREIIGLTLSGLSLRADEKDLLLAFNVDSEVPSIVVGDSVRVRQIIINLVGNAIKFTDHGEVFLRAQIESRTDTEVVLHFAVTDTGIGIEKDKLAIIFDPFVQADSSTTRKFGGTGLGLAICAELVTLMGGRMWVNSEVGHGSAFHFTAHFGLERSLPEVSSEERPGSVVASGRKVTKTARSLRILVAEDNPINQELAVEFLQLRGHSVTLAENGQAACEALEHDVFDVILMDLQMPIVDGFQAAHRIRENEKGTGCRVPIIALTGFVTKEDRQRCLDVGMDGFLAKPVRSKELFDAIDRVVAGPKPAVG